jgi:hypothetical protein
MGVDPVAEIMWPRIYKERTAKMHFSSLIVRPTFGGQGIEKSFKMQKVCLSVQRAHTGVVHVSTPSRLSMVQSCAKRSVQRLTAQAA